MSGPPAARRGGGRRRLVRRLADKALAALQHLLGRPGREQVHGERDDTGPAGLMARAETGAVVAVEVFVEQDEIAPVRVFLEFPGRPVYGPSAAPGPPAASAQSQGEPCCQ